MKTREGQSLFFITNTLFIMMKTFEIDEYVLESMIESLKESIGVTYTAPENPREQGYPYATGYSRSCMRSILETLESIKN